MNVVGIAVSSGQAETAVVNEGDKPVRVVFMGEEEDGRRWTQEIGTTKPGRIIIICSVVEG
ncbi:MAG: hypothetical protein ABI196_21575 [Bradyrhizobium sp.]